MKNIKIVKSLIKIANYLDENNLFDEANVLTKIAAEIDEVENPLDIDLDELDMFEIFDDSVKGRIVELRDDKGEGKADLGEPGDPMIVFFSYLPQKFYNVLNTENTSKLGTGDTVLLAEPGTMSEGYAAMAIIEKYKSNKLFIGTKVLE